MSWFSDLAGKAESLLNNLDEQTGAVLRNHNGTKEKKRDFILHPEGTLGQKKKTPRNVKKNGSISETRSSYTPTTRSPPVRQARSPSKQTPNNIRNGIENVRKKSPPRKAQYTLNNSPKTLVDDFNDHDSVDNFGLRHRRYSLPSDLEFINTEKLTYSMQNLEVENAMLKNELNVMNREVSELLDRLRKTEGELKTTQIKLESSEKLNYMLTEEKESLASQLQSKIQITDNGSGEINKYKEYNQELESSVSLLNYRNKELEDKIKELTEEVSVKNTAQIKLENELRHAQTTISEQQSNLEKTVAECHRLEKDWEAYKLRVKSMLFAKDNQIQSMRGGTNITEDNKILLEQIEILKDEKESLSQAISQVHNECDDMKRCMSQLEQQHIAAERVVTALRDTLKEERLARNRAEGHCAVLRKELQTLQSETNETILNLRTSLQIKDDELNNLRETTSTARTDSALNVADYDVIKEADSEKIHYLTQMLIQKQGKIDSLLADNNIMRIQLDKLESKHRSELAALQAKYSHSIVHLQDDSRLRTRNNYSSSPLSALSLRIGVMIKRFPIFRLLVLIYMIGLHLWVVTVLLTSTPEDYVPRPPKL